MKTIIQRFRFVVLILFFCLIDQLNASSLNTYFFAYGQDEEINIFWDYCGEENLLGCNMLRSETINGEYLQVNDNLITSLDNDFSFQDTTSIIDTLYYFYRINYVLNDSTFTDLSPLFSLKQVTFEVVNEEYVDMFLEMRKNQGYEMLGHVSWDNYSWETLFQMSIIDSVTLWINPYNYTGDYLLLDFYEWEQIPPWLGFFKISMDYLISIIVGADINNEIIIASPNILYQNYPNPFNPQTNINFNLTRSSKISLSIYNIKGQLVSKLIDNETFQKGIHSIIWNGKNNKGKEVSTNVYLYTLRIGDKSISRKMLLLR